MNRLDKGGNVFGGGETADAVAQVEDVRGALAGTHVRFAERIQDRLRLLRNNVWRRQQDRRVEVALEGLALSHPRTRLTQ